MKSLSFYLIGLVLFVSSLISCNEGGDDKEKNNEKEVVKEESNNITSQIETDNNEPVKNLKGPAYQKKVIELNESNFDEYISHGVSIVDFWANWCKPCLRQAPILEQTAAEFGDKARGCKIDVDENRNYAIKYKAESIPLMIIFKDGKEVKRLVGFNPSRTKDDFINLLKSYI